MKTILTVKTDKEVKEQAQSIAAELGLPLSTVVNAHLRQFIRSRSICFSMTPKMTPALEELVGRAEEDLRRGRNIAGPFDTIEEITADLDAPL